MSSLVKVLFIALLILQSKAAFGCTCAPPFPDLGQNRGPYDFYFENNCIVFSGRVITVKDTNIRIEQNVLEIHTCYIFSLR